MSALKLLKELGIELKPGKTIGIYGPSMVGKSVLATIIASEWAGPEGNVVIYGVEPHYSDKEYRALIESFIRSKTKYVNYCKEPEEVFKYMYMVEKRRFEGNVALILDSLSFIAMHEQAKWVSRGITEPRVYQPRVIPLVYTIAGRFKRLVIDKSAVGIMIFHAGSTAGTGKFRGITTYRPSMAMRVAHSLDYLLLLTSEGAGLESPRELTVVASRLTPLIEGRTVKFIFKDGTVVPVELSLIHI